MVICIVYILCFVLFAFAKPHDPASRVYDKKLSDFTHFDGDDHDTHYDHEAFLGKDKSDDFSNLSPEESKQKLLEIFSKIDTDHDKSVSSEELRAWLKRVSDKYVLQEVDKTFNDYTTEFKTDYVTFEQHKKRLIDDYDEDDEELNEVQKAISRDKKRFEKADADGDGKLSKSEFADFLHPEESDRMRDIVIDETMEDLDTNEDGVIDLEEYTKDMYDADENQQLPEWVQTEREQFKKVRDKDGSGFLDKTEVRDWLFPNDYNHIDSETKHLISEADDDRDGLLNRDEVLAHYDLFVGSQATDFGKALQTHEEL